MPFEALSLGQTPIHYFDLPAQTPPPSTVSPPLPLLLIHGLGASQNYYRPLLPYLSAHRLISFDSPGSARSPLPTTTPLSIAHIASTAIQLLDHLKIPKAVVVGASVGGHIAATLAADPQTADRVAGFVGLGALLPGGEQVKEIFGQRKKLVEEKGMEPLADTVPDAALGQGATGLQRAFVRELILGQRPEGYAAMCDVIANATPPEYGAVVCPVLLVVGLEDKSVPPEKSREMMKGLGGGGQGKGVRVLEEIEGMGHWHSIEDPERVGGLIAEFMRTVFG